MGIFSTNQQAIEDNEGFFVWVYKHSNLASEKIALKRPRNHPELSLVHAWSYKPIQSTKWEALQNTIKKGHS